MKRIIRINVYEDTFPDDTDNLYIQVTEDELSTSDLDVAMGFIKDEIYKLQELNRLSEEIK